MFDNAIILDVETKSLLDLTIVGTRNYFNDPSAEIFFLGYILNGDSEEVSVWEPGKTKLNLPLVPIVAQNYKMEYYAFCLLARQGHLTKATEKWYCDIMNYRCTKATGQRFGFGRSSLHDLGIQLNIKNKKSGSGKHFINQYSKPDKTTGTFLVDIHDPKNKQDKIDFIDYMKSDVLAARDIYNLLPKLHEDPHEWSIFQFDKIMNERGVTIDIPSVKKLIKSYNANIEQARQDATQYGFEKSGTLAVSSSPGLKRILREGVNSIPTPTLKKIMSEADQKKIESYLESYTVFANFGFLDKTIDKDIKKELRIIKKKYEGKLEDLLEKRMEKIKANWESWNVDNVQEKTLNNIYSSTTNKEIKNIIRIRRVLQAKAPKKLEKFLVLVDNKNVYYDNLNYFGTQPTGRWAGYGVQLHNIPRNATKDFTGDLKKLMCGEDIDIGSMLRGLLIPRKNHKFLVGDFASIELVILAWFARCDKILENKRNGISEYIEFAKLIYNKAVTKGTVEYNTGKQSVLSLGYGAGNRAPAFTFGSMLEKVGIYINTNLIDHIIKLYRKTYSEIPTFWGAIESVCKQALLHKGEKKTFRGLTFLFKGRALRVTLPSGRVLYYFNPSVDHHGRIKFGETNVWGGVLTAHVVSALARDLLTRAVIACEAAGLNPVLTVHDEIVNEVPTKDLKKAEKIFKKIMYDLPDWLEGLPLSADIGVMDRYGKL